MSELSQPAAKGLLSVEQQRAVSETQALVMVARAAPRDERAAHDRIINACTRPTLAKTAMYSYAKGGSAIEGPSIRLAEAMAQSWGNISFGIRELEQRPGESTMEAFAWDLETNTRQVKQFQVKHERRARGANHTLDDPRDVYELTANMGARRLRACILGILPGDVVEDAVKQCKTTLASQEDVSAEGVQKMVKAFDKFGVTQEQIEGFIQRRLDAMTAPLMVRLRSIYNSISDGMAKPGNFFKEPDAALPAGPAEAKETPAPAEKDTKKKDAKSYGDLVGWVDDVTGEGISLKIEGEESLRTVHTKVESLIEAAHKAAEEVTTKRRFEIRGNVLTGIEPIEEGGEG